jgi:hypothetical protein
MMKGRGIWRATLAERARRRALPLMQTREYAGLITHALGKHTAPGSRARTSGELP